MTNNHSSDPSVTCLQTAVHNGKYDFSVGDDTRALLIHGCKKEVCFGKTHLFFIPLLQ